MIKKISLIFFVVLNISLCYSQNYIEYYNEANEAEYQFIEGNYLSSKANFQILEKQYGKLLTKDYFYLAILCYNQNDSVNGKRCLKKSVEGGLYEVPNYISKFKSNKFPNLKISEKTILEMKLLEEKIIQSVDTTIRDTINFYLERDQLNRKEHEEVNLTADYPIQKNLLSFLKRNGLPNPYIYGDSYSIIILHLSDTEIYNSFTKFLYDEIIKGNMYPYYYTVIVDRTEEYKNKQTNYGSYFMKAKTQADTDKIKLNRKKIGLSPYFEGPNIFPHAY